MRFCFVGVAVFAAVNPLAARADTALTGLELSKIDAVMADINCRVQPEAVVREGNYFVLSDVFCADGEFTIRLDANFRVITKRAE